MMADNKLGICQICDSNEAKYKCPACGNSSCSLSCVRKHKAQANCSGIRNRVQMVPKEKMDNFTLLSDYRFLEEIDHKLEDGLRNPLRKSIMRQREMVSDLPYHLRRLKSEAKQRGTVIEYMPQHFSIHKENSTKYLYAEKKIRWHVKWKFPQADLSFTEKSIDEDILLLDLLQKYMEPPFRLDDEPSVLTPEELEKLAFYQSASYHRIVVLFKSNLCKFDKTYVEMVLSKSLKANLANRKVVEYPVFYVVLKDHLDSYLENESDEEDEVMETKSDALQNLNLDLRKKLQIQKPLKEKGLVGNRLSYFETFSDSSDDNE